MQNMQPWLNPEWMFSQALNSNLREMSLNFFVLMSHELLEQQVYVYTHVNTHKYTYYTTLIVYN